MCDLVLNAPLPPFEENLLHLFSCFCFTDSRFALFEELCKVDKKLTSLVCNLLATLLVKSRFHKRQRVATLKNVAITGSTYEGALVARMFRAFGENAVTELEVDFEFLAAELPISNKNIVEEISGKTGFAKVRMTRGLLKKYLAESGWDVNRKFFKDICTGFSENGYLKPYFIKEIIRKEVSRKLCSPYLLFALESRLSTSSGKNIKLILGPTNTTKATVMSYFDIYIDGKHIANAAWDLSIVIRLNWWPDIAREWIMRERNWPSKTVVSDLTKMSYLIMKSSVAPSLESDTELEMRYSFTHLEKELVLRRSLDQAYIYLIFKSMFYKWIKTIDSEVISSFIAKTIMFWVCEKYPPEHRIWQKKSCVGTLNHLFCELLSALEEKNLPYYFIPHINVIDMINDTVRMKMVSVVKEIVSDTSNFIPGNVLEVIEVSQEMFSMLKLFHGVFDSYHFLYTDPQTKKQLTQSTKVLGIPVFREILFYLIIFLIEMNRFCLIYGRKLFLYYFG